MRCLCGSGKFTQNCHDSALNKNELRNLLKYDHIGTTSAGKEAVVKTFKSMGFGRQIYKVKVTFRLATTPAGFIYYPQLIERNGKALRPLTIDGIHYENTDEGLKQYVTFMVTPVSSAHICFNPKDLDSGINGCVTAECIAMCEGNPFQSLYAIDIKDNRLKLYHHTTIENKDKIHSSQKLLTSKWNLKGTDELVTNHHIYFTNIDSIIGSFDLLEIGMACKGTDVAFCTDDGKRIADVEIYRDEINNRDAVLTVWVEKEWISPPPLILHEKGQHSNAEYSWWEVFASAIFRVSVKTFSFLPITCIGSDTYILETNENLSLHSGFIAALGMDPIGMRRILSELEVNDSLRPGGLTKADKGEPDPLWVKTWERSQSAVILDMMKSVMSSKKAVKGVSA